MKTYILVIFLFVCQIVNAQKTVYYEQVQKDLKLAKRLYESGNYISAHREFERIKKNLDTRSELYNEAEYYLASAALRSGHTSGSRLIRHFVEKRAESPYIVQAKIDYGSYQFDKKQYAQVLRTYSGIKRSELSEDDQIRVAYQSGFAQLMDENYAVAESEFDKVRNTNNLYSKPASYYWAHLKYLQEDYDAALDGFSQLNNDPSYSQVIPMYVSHIYYKQNRYQEVVGYSINVINDVEEEHKTELSKIVGDSYFHLKNYQEAIPYLETYFEGTKLKTREANYILGYCYYTTGQIDKASPLFEGATKGEDEMAQNAYYHLADCYIQGDEKEKAKMAYQAASEMEFSEDIKADALFNFAKLTYELSYSPFNETIKAFDSYIALYPNSERNAEAYEILTQVYMDTRNYQEAIESIHKIQSKTPSILKAYQRVTFFRGLELFNNLSYHQAIDLFDTSLESGGGDNALKARALYWKGEALFLTGDYNEAIRAYSGFKSTPGATKLGEYRLLPYNMAYAYFKLEDYQSGVGYFQDFVSNNLNERTEKQADAFNRIGDYYYLNTQYSRAIENYEKAFRMKHYDADYALFQIAFCQGLLRDQNAKIRNLETMLTTFPESEYQDDAMYELGRAYERTGKSADGIRLYQRIINEYAESNYYRKALLQMGLINYNQEKYDIALKQYKEVVERYKGSEEAKTALSGIKNCYIELNRVDDYFAYVQSQGGGTGVSATEQDALTYQAAERIYMAGDSKASEQLRAYLERFPNGSYRLNASFYLAETLYKEGKEEESNTYYKYVAQQPANLFSEQALSRTSELTFNEESYEEAMGYFNKLEKLANSKWNVLKANTGQMRCNMILNRYEPSIAAAIKVKDSDIANDVLIREANYAEGKSHYSLNDKEKALPGLQAVAEDTQYEQGAEAKYLIAEIYYDQNKKAEAEKEIMDFIDKNSPYQYWLGRSFLLLTRIYQDNGDDFTAKHTLKSIVDNYGNDTDGVKDEALKILAEIEDKEAAEQKSAVDSSFQMEIKQN